MKHLTVMLILLAASCLMPTEPATSTDSAALGASWYDVRDEGRRLCAVIDAEGCALTREPWWWPDCLAKCTRLADEAQATGCLNYAEDMHRCEWAEQERFCWGIYPYVTTDNCRAEGDSYAACKRGL